MGLLGDLLRLANEIDVGDDDEKRKKDDLEREMDAYELEDWQKDLVRKGDYDSCNFEDDDDDLEEDDYYYEDDNEYDEDDE